MFIHEVIPLAALPPQAPQLLSYFWNQPLVRGSVVEITVGNRKMPAVVISSSPLEKEKASLKKSVFQLKKISGIISEAPLVSGEQLKTSLWLAQSYFAPLGLCLKTVLPKFFLKTQPVTDDMDFENKEEKEIKPEILLTAAKDIFKNIEPEIRQTLESGKQVLIILPEIHIAELFHNRLAGHSETALIHGKISIKKYTEYWSGMSSGKIKLVIGTSQALFAPFSDLGLIIVENPANPAYKSDRAPKYRTADLAVFMSSVRKSRLILVERTPAIGDLFRVKNDGYKIRVSVKSDQPEVKIINMIEEFKSGSFSVIGRCLADSVADYAVRKKNILIFSPRKGYLGLIFCKNCNFSFKCPRCSVPLRLHKTADKFLVCHRCSFYQNMPLECPNCRSYELKAGGMPGNEKIKENLEKILNAAGLKPEISIVESGSLITPPDKKDAGVIEPGSHIYIATQAIFSRRYDMDFDLIGLPNIDALAILPDFKSEENMFQEIQKIMDFEPEKIILQTFEPENKILEWAVKNKYEEFYNSELGARKMLFYPPFSRLAKISFKHSSREKAGQEARSLNERLKIAVAQRRLNDKVKLLEPSSAFVEKEKGLYIFNIILKISLELPPHEILRFVPSNWDIDIDPKSIL